MRYKTAKTISYLFSIIITLFMIMTAVTITMMVTVGVMSGAAAAEKVGILTQERMTKLFETMGVGIMSMFIFLLIVGMMGADYASDKVKQSCMKRVPERELRMNIKRTAKNNREYSWKQKPYQKIAR